MTGDACSGVPPDATAQVSPPSVEPQAARGTEIIFDQSLEGDSLYQLRASVAAHALRAGLSRRRADDVVIAAHELAANVVRHGSGRGRLRIWQHEHMLHCQVSDDGHAERADGTAPAWRIEPGHGLWLVRQLADSFSPHPGRFGSAVTVSFSLSPVATVLPFTLAEHRRGASTVLQVAGQLDVNSADELTGAIERLLAREPAAVIVIDLAGLTFWDAFGLAGLLRAQDRVEKSQGASMMLASVPAMLASHLAENGLAERFDIQAGKQPESPGATDPVG
jgi:anti-anti-sigma factor